MSLHFVTRASTLARQQTATVIQSLQTAWPGLECRVSTLSTRGDRELDRALPEIGGKGLFTQELEAAILSGDADAAVHSLKDLPVDDPPALTLGAIPARQDVRDVLVSPQNYHLTTLPEGARVGTSSPRRAAQLLAARPDLQIKSLRGNVDSRLQKVEQGEYDAIVLAAAGLIRINRQSVITEWLPVEVMLPAPGQAALAVQCLASAERVLELLAPLEHSPTRLCVTAERAFLSGLGGGCALPIAAFAEPEPGGLIHLRGLVASRDGKRVIRLEQTGDQPRALGAQLARQAREAGAQALLSE